MENHEIFMRRALELALRGKGNVAPNPLVGCVIVKDETVISEGWHQFHGGPHAEVQAVNQVLDSSNLEGATVYVNLEPCSHQGLTPPCAPMLAQLPIKKVVIANVDPNPIVEGNGIALLEKEGIEVITGVLDKEGEKVNRRFFTFHRKKRPYIILKWAQTSDGFIARLNRDSKWISNPLSRKIVHKWRAENAAILVGNTTADADDPQLNTRDWTGKDPIRIIIDRKLSLSSTLKVYTDQGATLTYNIKEDRKEGNKEFIKVQQVNFIGSIMNDLYERNIQSVMVEGGSTIHRAFMEENLWDECRIFQSSSVFGEGISAPELPAPVYRSETILDNQLFIIKNQSHV